VPENKTTGSNESVELRSVSKSRFSKSLLMSEELYKGEDSLKNVACKYSITNGCNAAANLNEKIWKNSCAVIASFWSNLWSGLRSDGGYFMFVKIAASLVGLSFWTILERAVGPSSPLSSVTVAKVLAEVFPLRSTVLFWLTALAFPSIVSLKVSKTYGSSPGRNAKRGSSSGQF